MRTAVSDRLVHRVFGDTVPPTLAARILLFLLFHGVVTVVDKDDERKTIVEHEWPSLCSAAALGVSTRNHPADFPSGMAEGIVKLNTRYEWSWQNDLRTDSAADAANFLNVVGFMAYIFARAVDPRFRDVLAPKMRFAVPTQPAQPFPLSANEELKEKCPRPGMFALPTAAFPAVYPDTDTDHHHVQDLRDCLSPLRRTQDLFPDVLKYAGKLDAASPELLDSGFCPNASDLQGLRTELEALFATLRSELRPDTSLPPSEAHDLLAGERQDISYACWPGVLITGAYVPKDIGAAIDEAILSMQQQRAAQPFLRYTLGLAFTEKSISFLRGDPVGIELQVLETCTAVGVLEAVSLALGLIVADDQHLGLHPAFEFGAAIRTSGLSDNKVQAATSTQRASSQHVVQPEDMASTASLEEERSKDQAPSGNEPSCTPRSYRFREATFFTVPLGNPSGGPQIKQRYYLDYLVYGSSSVTGRQTRVWCAYKEASGDDPNICDEHRQLVSKDDRVYVGPYALKMSHADVATEAYKLDIVGRIKRRADEDGAKYLLLPDFVSYGERIRVSREQSDRGVDVTEYQETISVSLFKRTLGQYVHVGEVVRAIIDMFRAIEWLASIGIVHRDISDGNILLARETPSLFTDPQTRTCRLLLGDRDEIVTAQTLKIVRRCAPARSEGVFGLLHDFDMAGRCETR
ncbi:hypothetical protein L226DRAFT_529063 [Lentinus tigrinus ALCF2SS1-7]|uniref:Uncharacterized protein n=1 Tax=Lentinus tigrinus ALCF2SS1-6 TaxID=1328759 RepID=A0A5C2SN32_9APHY|nr:hypothetical protein L227DRAFT_607221 [Lentinus tigrinus ALCF2SS1-6]RPD82940.1 hypothetical protein L226DRAFT_529063 [Lentinus tigrinus ALCF2SS1-7]